MRRSVLLESLDELWDDLAVTPKAYQCMTCRRKNWLAGKPTHQIIQPGGYLGMRQTAGFAVIMAVDLTMKEKTMKRNEVILSLRRFRETHHAKYSIVRIGIFGSAARDSMTDKSDIDIVVDLEKPDYLNLIGIKQALEEQLHCPVDIVRYRDNMNKYLKQRIDREAIYV